MQHYEGNLPEMQLKRKYPLNAGDLRKHIEGKIAYGVKFRPTSSKLIGLDIDVRSTEVLRAVRDRLIELGIAEEHFLMTDSGGKGYHVDIFLAEPVAPALIQRFYDEQIIEALAPVLRNVDSKKEPGEIIELRGASRQGYRLPLGTHPSKGKACYPIDVNGEGLDSIRITHSIIKSKTIMECGRFAEIVNVKAYKPLLTVEQGNEIEEITEGVHDNNIKLGNRKTKEAMLKLLFTNKELTYTFAEKYFDAFYCNIYDLTDSYKLTWDEAQAFIQSKLVEHLGRDNKKAIPY